MYILQNHMEFAPKFNFSVDFQPQISIISGNRKQEILQGLGVDPGSATECWPYRKNAQKSFFFVKKLKLPKHFFQIFFLVMQKYWGKQIFRQGGFPEVASFALSATTGGSRKQKEYSNDQGLVQTSRPNTGRKKQKNLTKICFCKKKTF